MNEECGAMFVGSECCFSQSSAFRFVERLGEIGIQDQALEMCHLSYLSMALHIEEHAYEPHLVKYGVPQGSVLGHNYVIQSVLSSAHSLIRKYGVSYHVYADDTQLYVKMFHPLHMLLFMPLSMISKSGCLPTSCC